MGSRAIDLDFKITFNLPVFFLFYIFILLLILTQFLSPAGSQLCSTYVRQSTKEGSNSFTKVNHFGWFEVEAFPLNFDRSKLAGHSFSGGDFGWFERTEFFVSVFLMPCVLKKDLHYFMLMLNAINLRHLPMIFAWTRSPLFSTCACFLCQNPCS